MSIDFSKYSIKELHEAWISIDDHAYPDRAIEIYQLLKAHGEEAHIEVGIVLWMRLPITFLALIFQEGFLVRK